MLNTGDHLLNTHVRYHLFRCQLSISSNAIFTTSSNAHSKEIVDHILSTRLFIGTGNTEVKYYAWGMGIDKAAYGDAGR
jgi:hypothetical protein